MLWEKEFNDISFPGYSTYLQHSQVEHNLGFLRGIKNYHASIYCALKFLNMEPEIEEIRNYIINMPDDVFQYLDCLGILILRRFNLMNFDINHTLESLRVASLPTSFSNTQMPIEIGEFLLKKMIPAPNSYYGCINIIENYKQTNSMTY